MFNIYSKLIENKKVQKVNINDSIEKILKDMKYNTIPVVDNDNKYLGVINKVCIYEKIFNENIDLKTLTIQDFLINHEAITQNDKLEDILNKLINNRYLFLSVVDEKNVFLGIIPNSKIIKYYSNSIGIDNTDSISLVTYDSLGTLNRITKILKKYKTNIISLSTIDLSIMNLKHLYFKVDCNEKYSLKFIKDKLKEEGFNNIE